jgi:hypothetical protein
MAIYLSAALAMIFKLKRACPRCKREQVVPLSKRTATVACRFCQAPVPPPAT